MPISTTLLVSRSIWCGALSPIVEKKPPACGEFPLLMAYSETKASANADGGFAGSGAPDFPQDPIEQGKGAQEWDAFLSF